VAPPLPIRKNVYLCDKRFHVELLEELFAEDHETVGYIIVHGEDALFATVCGTRTTLLGSTIGHLLGETRRGGQSAPRFGRIAEGRRDNYAKRIGERAWELFGPAAGSSRHVDRIILGGPAGVKSRVLKQWPLELQPIVVTLSRGGEEGLRECIIKAADPLTAGREQDDVTLLTQFYSQLDAAPDTLVVGNEIARSYHQGLLQSLWTTDPSSLGPEFLLDGDGEAPNPNSRDTTSSSTSTSTSLYTTRGRRMQFGTTLFVVSANTELGTQFEREFMGLAALSWTSSESTITDPDEDLEE